MHTVRALTVVIAVWIGGAGPVQAAPIYSRAFTPPAFGKTDFIVAVADFNGDGWQDIVIGGNQNHYSGNRSQRFKKKPLYLLLSKGDGTFRDGTAELVLGEFKAFWPVGVVGDFNGDGRPDLAIFDAGIYEPGQGGFGNPPLLFLSGPDRRLHASTALADAVADIHTRTGAGVGADLHIKSATAGDVNNDGRLDIWVESCGGHNVCSHFMMNKGDGTFAADIDRVPFEALHNPPPEFWRHVSSALVDLNNDGHLDLVLGQIRDLDVTHINQASLVIFNNGTGHFPLANRVLLPRPQFNDGFTSVDSIAAFDLDGDGLKDLVLAHQRNDDGPPGIEPFTGRYIQVLVNKGGSKFVDETVARMGDQSATTRQRSSIYGGFLRNEVEGLAFIDVDKDGHPDLVMGKGLAPIGSEAPLVHLNDGTGHFRVLDPKVFTRGELGFGDGSVPLDLNGDGVVDFVHPDFLAGPDGIHGTDDDINQIVALVGQLPASIWTNQAEYRAGDRMIVRVSTRPSANPQQRWYLVILVATPANTSANPFFVYRFNPTIELLTWADALARWPAAGQVAARPLSPLTTQSFKILEWVVPNLAPGKYRWVVVLFSEDLTVTSNVAVAPFAFP